MKYWELEHGEHHVRIEWNEKSTFNLQTPIGGQWVDYHCFTCYNLDNAREAFDHAYEVLTIQEPAFSNVPVYIPPEMKL